MTPAEEVAAWERWLASLGLAPTYDPDDERETGRRFAGLATLDDMPDMPEDTGALAGGRGGSMRGV